MLPVISVDGLLGRARDRLAARLMALEAQLDADDDGTTWREYRETAAALAAILPATVPGADGKVLTSRELADRLGISPRTLRRKAKAGAPLAGRSLRWFREAAAR
jgi:hypothetical protein